MSQTDAQSALDFEEVASAATLTFSSEPASWTGLPLRGLHHLQGRGLSVPPMAEDLIILHSGGPTRLQAFAATKRSHQTSGPGQLYITPRGEPSSFSWTDPCDVIHVYVPRHQLARSALETLDIDPVRVELIPLLGERDPLLEQLCRALHAELRAIHPLGRLYVESLTESLKLHLLRHYRGTPIRPPPVRGGLRPTVLRQVVQYVDAHLHRDLSLGELAGIAALSQFHFARLFRQSMGISLHRYVRERRLEEAGRLLRDTTLTLAAVAELTGFADQSHFSREFKRRYGVAPGVLARSRRSS